MSNGVKIDVNVLKDEGLLYDNVGAVNVLPSAVAFALASAISGDNVHLGAGEGASASFGKRVDAGNHG